MLSDKEHVLELVALLKAYHIEDIVISPGSRNAPLIQTFSQSEGFNCHLIVDERNAAFYAIGIILAKQKPVVVCCTSGTAMLNYAPAVAEAYYQELPLIVISADRPQEWIGQMDGQTIPQLNAFASMTVKSVQINEISLEQDKCYVNRLINEALIASTCPNPRPVHINIAIKEPLFDYNIKKLPTVRKIDLISSSKREDITQTNIYSRFMESTKLMIVIGQMQKTSSTLRKTLNELAEKHNCVILCEHLSNAYNANTISNFDQILYGLGEEDMKTYSPDLMISFGGHIVSKRLKQFLRTYKAEVHWHLAFSTNIVDPFQSLTSIIETDIEYFLKQLANNSQKKKGGEFYSLWQNASEKAKEPTPNIFSDISATGQFLRSLPSNSNLHLANSSAVRNAQFFDICQSINVYCNRGTNGIESSLPSAIGYASVSQKPSYLIIGDLSFFYTIGALWNIKHIKNLRILLINNNSGAIFHLLPKLNESASIDKYVSASHNINAQKWTEAAGMQYLKAENSRELNEKLKLFYSNDYKQSIILEVKVDLENCKSALKEYYHQFKR